MVDTIESNVKTVEEARNDSIQSRAHDDSEIGIGGMGSIGGIFQYLFHSGELVSPWWSTQRDVDLRRFVKNSDHLNGSTALLTSKIVNIPVEVQPRDMALKSHVKQADEYNRRLIEESEFGQGWITLASKWLDDWFSCDSGAFMEIIGDGPKDGPIKGPALGLASLDSTRTIRKKDVEFPVSYIDEDGYQYRLHHTRVAYASDQPSNIVEMRGVGMCSVSRAINVSQNLIDISTYKQEKLGSRPMRAIMFTPGIPADVVENTLKMSAEMMDNRGQRRYSSVPILGGNETDARVELISLSSLPDGFDEETSTRLGMFAIALAFGVPIRWIWPAATSGATKADAMYQHIAGLGGGIGRVLKTLTLLLGGDPRGSRHTVGKFLPPHLKLVFDFQDDEQDRMRAEIQKTRVETAATALEVGLITLRVSREQSLEEGDVSQAQFDAMELSDGRLPSGEDILTLFYAGDEGMRDMLDLGVEDALDVQRNDREATIDAIEDKMAETRQTISSAASTKQKQVAKQAMAALGKLREAYVEVKSAQQQATDAEGEEQAQGEDQPTVEGEGDKPKEEVGGETEEGPFDKSDGEDSESSTKVWSSLSSVPKNLRSMHGATLSLDQANHLARMADAIERNGQETGIAWATARNQFKKLYTRDGGVWVKREEGKKGGPGSGHHDHRSVPGQRGGSAPSKSLSLEAKGILDKVYNTGEYSKPKTLTHYVGGEKIPSPSTIENIRQGGLQASHGGWKDVDTFIPNRPEGVFLWGEEMSGRLGSNRVQVEVSDLDMDSLYAFPAELAGAANYAATGREMVPGVKEAMRAALAVPFSEYDGQFAAEFVYTKDIPPEIMSWWEWEEKGEKDSGNLFGKMWRSAKERLQGNKGGPGSGHHKHRGVPGKVGGSAPGSGLGNTRERLEALGVRVADNPQDALNLMADAYEKKHGWDQEHTREGFIENRRAILGTSQPPESFRSRVMSGIADEVEAGRAGALPLVIREHLEEERFTGGTHTGTHIEVLYDPERIDSEPEEIGRNPSTVANTYPNSYGGIYVHEWGHHISTPNMAMRAAVLLDDPQSRKLLKTGLSRYSIVNSTELVAEAYTASVHPDYDSLSSDVQGFIQYVLTGESEGTKAIERFKGGPGSGHHKHRGVLGKRGGSAPGSSANWATNAIESYESGEAQLISSETLSSNVYATADAVIKEPKLGFSYRWTEFGGAMEIVSNESDSIPSIKYARTSKGPVLVQKRIDIDTTREVPETVIQRLSTVMKDAGYTPRDMRPGNVVYDTDGKVWIIDIGEWDYPLDVVKRGWEITGVSLKSSLSFSARARKAWNRLWSNKGGPSLAFSNLADRVLDGLKSLTTAIKQTAGALRYRRDLMFAVQNLWNGNISRADFIDVMNQLIPIAFEQATLDAVRDEGITSIDQLEEEEQKVLQDRIALELTFVAGFADYIIAHSKAEGFKLRSLAPRVNMWAARYGDVADQARLAAGGVKKYEFVYDPLKENCWSCLKLNGQVRRMSAWKKFDCRPKHPDLECMHSANGPTVCGCEFMETDKPSSRGPLPRWRAA